MIILELNYAFKMAAYVLFVQVGTPDYRRAYIPASLQRNIRKFTAEKISNSIS